MSTKPKVIVAVWDSAVQAYATPFTFQTAQVAVRSFTDEVNRADPNNSLHQHPSDYELHHIADWDETTGVYLNFKEGPICLARAKDFKLP